MRAVNSLRARYTIILALLAAASGLATAASAAQVTQFSPQGTVREIRQVTARFSEAMVPFGDPRETAGPFEINCPEPGTARWVDTRNWAYDFDRDLPAGLRCTFSVRAGLLSLAGNPISGQETFSFSTGGPVVRYSRPWEGDNNIYEDQAFILFLDAEATESSILENVSFSVEGVPERVGVRLVTGEDRQAILKTLGRYYREGPRVVLQARQSFPVGARVALTWGKGVASEGGVQTVKDQILKYKVRPDFKARFWCRRERKDASCTPVAAMSLDFSDEVSWDLASRITLQAAGGKRWTPEPPEDEPIYVDSVSFPGPFPEKSTFVLTLPEGFQDHTARTLTNADKFPLTVKTEAFPPLAKFSSRFSIVESADPVLPVTLRNVEAQLRARSLEAGKKRETRSEEIYKKVLWHLTGKVWRISPERIDEMIPWLRKVAGATREESIFASADEEVILKSFKVPKPEGADAFEVVGIPLSGPGLYILELESGRLGAALLGEKRPMYVPAAALVTNLSVHFKWGSANSLVWVTTLDKGRPVPAAWVAVHDCRGLLLWSGRTDRRGIARIENLPAEDALPACPIPAFRTNNDIHHADFRQTPALNSLGEGLFITARKEDDLSFVHTSWNEGIEPWRYQLGWGDSDKPVIAHTILDRPLFRAGETVHMKHVIRGEALSGFSQVPPAERPTKLLISHAGSMEKYEFPLVWDEAGISENEWAIPKQARLGLYRVSLSRPPRLEEVKGLEQLANWITNRPDWGRSWYSGEFRVEEFRVPLMKGIIHLPAGPQIAASRLPVNVAVQYLAGGGAARLPVRLRAQIGPGRVPSFEGFDGFNFANGGIKAGITRLGDDEEAGEQPGGKPSIHQRVDLVLDAAGTAQTNVTDLPKSTMPQDLLTELEFRDPNGEVQTVSSRIPLWPAGRLVGIKPDSWLASRESLKVKAAVVDVSGSPVEGVSVAVRILERRTHSSRKRLVGGFYAYEHAEEVLEKGILCEGATDKLGLISCEGKPPVAGSLILQASIRDEAGNETAAHTEVWVAGSRDWWFRVADHDRIDLLPEKKRYEPGETARLQVRMPFREATALVTAERDGVIDAFVAELSGKEAVIEVPVKGEYAPNIFISALVVRGRAGEVQPTAMVDLGKPAYKLGIAEIRVGWQAHELKVKVESDHATYDVRGKANLKISVRAADGKRPPPGSEVALAAVDEGLLELRPNESWKLLEAMMNERSYNMSTSTAQMQVVGKRHYGRKALPAGGGGGQKSTRELFDTLLLWKGRVALSAGGDATVEIPLNDSLTSFRAVAVATGGTDKFGTGSTAFRTTQDLMILPGIPPLVREGDRFQAEITARNTTDRAMKIALKGQVKGLPEPLSEKEIELPGGEARTVGWEITTPLDVRELAYEMEAEESGGATDRVRVSQKVVAAVPVRTYQATLLRLEGEEREAVERPSDSIPGRGGIEVALSRSLLDGIGGVRDWMRDYPYTCLEQRVSRAIALQDTDLWQKVAATLPAHLDSDGLLKFFTKLRTGSDALTSYVLAVTHEAGFRIPPGEQERMITGLQLFLEGRVLRSSDIPAADLSIRKLAAIEALARYGKANPKYLDSIVIDPNLWPTSAVLDWWSILRRVKGVPDREDRLREADQILRARLNFQGTTMRFSTEDSDALWWLMVSSDTNAVRLLLGALGEEGWREDVPRLLQGALARQSRGAWDITVANAWGVLAVRKFAETFEATPVEGTSSASLAASKQSLDWAQAPKGKMLSFPWPEKREELRVGHAGTGRPWVTLRSKAAIPLTAPLSSGYRITKTLTPLEQKEPGKWSRGDVIRVRLEIEAQTGMTWVVVSDPIPAGASHLGTGLGRDSKILSGGEEQDWTAWPAYEERSFENYRGYYRYVPKGNFALEYTMRLNQSGLFRLSTTRVEALYAPELFGEQPNDPMEILP